MANIPFEALKEKGAKIAMVTASDPNAVTQDLVDEITRKLVHAHGVQNVDFTGGAKASPDDDSPTRR